MAQVGLTSIALELNRNGTISVYLGKNSIVGKYDSTHATLSLAIERVIVLRNMGYASDLENGKKIITDYFDELFRDE